MCSRKQEELSSSSFSLLLSDLPRTKSSVWPLLIHIMRSIHQKAVKRFCRRMHANKNLNSLSGAIYRPAAKRVDPLGPPYLTTTLQVQELGRYPSDEPGYRAISSASRRQPIVPSAHGRSCSEANLFIPSCSFLILGNPLDINSCKLSCLSTHESLPESLRWTQSRRAAPSAPRRWNVIPLSKPIYALPVPPNYCDFLFSPFPRCSKLGSPECFSPLRVRVFLGLGRARGEGKKKR